ncbi:MAG: LapA family protein [Solirubrobacteraceae bacterium]
MADPSPSSTPAKRTLRDTLRIGVAVALAVLITIFAVLNVKSVQVDWIFGSSRAPLIIVIVVSLLVGGALTYLGERRIRRR